MYEFTILGFLEYLKVYNISIEKLKERGIGREVIIPRRYRSIKTLTLADKKGIREETIKNIHRALNELGVDCDYRELRFAFLNDNFTFLIEWANI